MCADVCTDNTCPSPGLLYPQIHYYFGKQKCGGELIDCGLFSCDFQLSHIIKVLTVTLFPQTYYFSTLFHDITVDCFCQICERSLSRAQGGPMIPPVQSFVRAEILPSGYLIRPCEGGGCIIHIVDHMDLEACFIA